MAGNRAELYHSLSVMLGSGVPVLKSLRLAASTGRGSLSRAFHELAEAASAGQALAETMARNPKDFSPIEVLLVGAAERSGRLPESLERLSRFFVFRDRIRHVLTTGLLLPVVVLHVAALVIPLPPFVLGQVGPTRYLLQVAAILAFFYVPAAVVFVVVRFTPKTGPLRALLDALTLKVPLLGRAVRQLALSRYCRTFHMLYECGSVPVEECAQKSADVTGNMTVRRWLLGAVESARAGSPVSEGFSSRLPAEFREMWLIGEEAGSLGETTARLADVAAEDSERLFSQFSAWLPRLIYALVCIFIIIHIFRGASAIYGRYQSVLDGL